MSTASLWELSIKVAKGNLHLPGDSVRSLYEQVELLGIMIVPVEKAHILRVEMLPHHHRDPFDRMIVAQAMEEGFTILSSDRQIAEYAVPVVWR